MSGLPGATHGKAFAVCNPGFAVCTRHTVNMVSPVVYMMYSLIIIFMDFYLVCVERERELLAMEGAFGSRWLVSSGINALLLILVGATNRTNINCFGGWLQLGLKGASIYPNDTTNRNKSISSSFRN